MPILSMGIAGREMWNAGAGCEMGITGLKENLGRNEVLKNSKGNPRTRFEIKKKCCKKHFP